MIKNIKTNQDALSTAHTTLTGKKLDGFVVCNDTKRIYYQSSDSTVKPIFIGGAEKWVNITTTTTYQLSGNMNFVRQSSGSTLKLPSNNVDYPFATGDTIRLFNINSSAFTVKNYAGTTKLTVYADRSPSTAFTFFWDGADWEIFEEAGSAKKYANDISSFLSSYVVDGVNIRTSSISKATASGDYGVVTLLSSVNPSDHYNSNTKAQVPEASAIMRATSSLISSTVDDFYNFTTTKILTTALPSAVTTIASSTVNNGAWTNTGTFGITQIEGSTSAEVISGSKLPMAASAIYKYIANQNIDSKLQGRLTSVTINDRPYTSTTNAIDLGNKYVEVDNPQVGQYVVRTSTGYVTSTGIATLSSTHSSSDVASNLLTVKEAAIPVMIKTASGSFYPVEKDSLTFDSSTNKFKIDTRPYLAYEKAKGYSGNFTGSWIIYYGAGINDIWSKANTVKSITTGGTSYNALFGTADVYVITISGGSGNFNILIPVAPDNADGLPIGHGMIFKVINQLSTRNAYFAGNQITSGVGQYTFSVFNFTGVAEQVGTVAKVKSTAS